MRIWLQKLTISFIIWGIIFVSVGFFAGALLHELLLRSFGIGHPWNYFLTMPVVLFFLIVPLIIWMNYNILGPVRRIIKTNRKVAEGDYESTDLLKGEPKNEIGEIMRTRKEMLESLFRYHKQLEDEKEFINVINNALLSMIGGNVDEGLVIVIEHVCKILGMKGGWTILKEMKNDTFRLSGSCCGSGTISFHDIETLILKGDCPCTELLSQKNAKEVRPQVRSCERLKALGEKRPTLVLPLVVDDEVVGVIDFLVPDGFELSEDMRILLMNTASSVALAISRSQLVKTLSELNATLDGRVHERTCELQVLYDFSQQIGYTLNYEELFHTILSHLHRAISYDVAASIITIDDKYNIIMRSVASIVEGVQEMIQKRLVRSLRRMSGREVRVESIHEMIVKVDKTEKGRPAIKKIDASFLAPIVVKEETIGIIFVGREGGEEFTEDNIRLLYTIANHSSISMERIKSLLASEQRRLESMVEHLPEGLMLLDDSFRILFANPVAKEYLRSLTDARIGDILDLLGKTSIDDIIKSTSNGQYHDIILEEPEQRIFEVAMRPIEKDLRVGRFIMIIKDVTEMRSFQESIRQQDRLAAVGQLAAGIAHDFNNILTSVIGFSEILQLDQNLPENSKKRLSTIAQQGKRAADLIQQILDFSRQSIPQKSSVNLLPFIMETVKLMERIIPESIKITFEAEPGDYIVNADLTQMQQVITNLSVNSRDAMPDGGVLRLRLSRFILKNGDTPPCPEMKAGEWVRFTVEDTGEGIPPEIIPHIFEPFFTTKGPGRGTGLGLAQVYGIIKQHGGYVLVKSTTGKGTKFTIYLPYAIIPSMEDKSVETDEPLDLNQGSGKTILVVDDEPQVVKVVKDILESIGYNVLMASDAKQALEVHEKHKGIALVLTDMVMPDMTGMELLNTLKSKDPSIKVVLMTGYPLGEDGDELSHGIDWIQKPIKVNNLAKVIKNLLGK